MGSTLKVTAKGQVTLKRELLEHLGAAPGTEPLSIDAINQLIAEGWAGTQ